MTTDAKIGYGYLFRMWDANASPPAYVKLAEVTMIKPPGITTDAVDTTHTESPNGVRESIPGLATIGDGSVTLNFVPGGATQARIHAAAISREVQLCEIDFQNASPPTLWRFGAILSYDPELPLDDKGTTTLTLKPTGVQTILNAPTA